MQNAARERMYIYISETTTDSVLILTLLSFPQFSLSISECITVKIVIEERGITSDLVTTI